LLAIAFTVAMKWLVVGRYRAGEKTAVCSFVWRNELVKRDARTFRERVAGRRVESHAVRVLVFSPARREDSDGAFTLRRRTLSEFDLATIGDEATLNARLHWQRSVRGPRG